MFVMEEKAEKEVKIIKNINRCCGGGGMGGAVYGLGFVGAAIYFIQHSVTFTDGVIGILKALVWPAFLVFKAFELLKF